MPGILVDEFQIDACLERHASSVREIGPQAWEFTLAGETNRKGIARLDFDWLTLDVPLTRPRGKGTVAGRRLAEVLSLSGRIGGLAKFGFEPATKRLHLQAEIPLVLDHDPMERIDLAFASFEEALAALDAVRSGEQDGASENAGDAASVVHPNGIEPTAESDELKERCRRWKELCEESAWPLHERSSGKLAVSLDVPGSFCQAVIEASGPHAIRIRHEAGRQPLNEMSQRALSTFLLVGTRTVRMARSYIEHPKSPTETSEGPAADSVDSNGEGNPQSEVRNPQSDEVNFGWEIVLQDPPALFELDRALSALSMACRLSTNELPVLAEEEVARRYLAVQGMVS